MFTLSYAGVGSRSTPEDIQRRMGILAYHLAFMGYTLRSGGAMGADAAFETGCDAALGRKEIFTVADATKEAMEIASQFHPAWHNCKEYARWLHARNVFQIMGRDLRTPSDFVICWTPGGKPIGGTRTAIEIAKANGVQVYNMGDVSSIEELNQIFVR